SRTTSEVNYKFIRYSGKERDATGLYYYGLRYYQPWIGRWINPDPAGTVDSQNLYCMVNNNSVTMVDAYGTIGEKPRSTISPVQSDDEGDGSSSWLHPEPEFDPEDACPGPSSAVSPTADDDVPSYYAPGFIPPLCAPSTSRAAASTFEQILPFHAPGADASTSEFEAERAVALNDARVAVTSAPADPPSPNPLSAGRVADEERSLRTQMGEFGIDWVPYYSHWTRGKEPWAWALHPSVRQAIEEDHGRAAGEAWDSLVSYVYDREFQALDKSFSERWAFKLLCEIAGIQDDKWDEKVASLIERGMRQGGTGYVSTHGDFDGAGENFEQWMTAQEIRFGTSSQRTPRERYEYDYAAGLRQTHISNELVHLKSIVTSARSERATYRYETLDPQRPGHEFRTEISEKKIRLLTATRPQDSPEYSADDVTLFHMGKARGRGLSLKEVDFLQIDSDATDGSLKDLVEYRGTHVPLPSPAFGIFCERWSRNTPGFDAFIYQTDFGAYVNTLVDHMGAFPTALWRRDYMLKDDPRRRTDLYIFIKRRGGGCHYLMA
ncbi:RHS repeat-associated core domain-containing protein, partial [Achromobacter aloeverae]